MLKYLRIPLFNFPFSYQNKKNKNKTKNKSYQYIAKAYVYVDESHQASMIPSYRYIQVEERKSYRQGILLISFFSENNNNGYGYILCKSLGCTLKTGELNFNWYSN